jgi:hypothetical protein
VGVGLGVGEDVESGGFVAAGISVISGAGDEVMETGVSSGTLAAHPEPRVEKRMIVIQMNHVLRILCLEKASGISNPGTKVDQVIIGISLKAAGEIPFPYPQPPAG